MINRSTLLSDLQKLVKQLEADLAERSDAAEVPEVKAALRAEYEKAQKAERTAQSYEVWRGGYATQVAVAWVLGAVFARFLEDNGLVEQARISGPGERLQRARDEHELYFRAHPLESDRAYLLAVFRALGALPGMGAIFVEQSPVFELPTWLSGDGAKAILSFFQRIEGETGALVHDFTDENLESDEPFDTRFLGDLYQDLSMEARKRYALLQTPIFVEEFILDRTLDPAIEEFGLEDFRMIDPACGSGHFLLGAFERILDRWFKKDTHTNKTALAQRALDAVHGVDVNPYAVAISRFRLLLAAMKASGGSKLKNAPGFVFKLACGDSLLHGEGSQLVLGEWAPMAHHFQTEDIAALNGILRTGYFHAVVANPPYIVPRDKALNAAYRGRYESCYRQYSLAVPFMERIFRLAVPGGFTGQITANSFMKREFGKKLIESFLPKVDLTHVIDTSGAYIPGHGTPTVILFGRNRAPVANAIRTVMGIRGEPSTPSDAAQGLVWSAIVKQVDIEGSESAFVSVENSLRDLFDQHPWSMSGGGAFKLKQTLDKSFTVTLQDVVDSVGFFQDTHADEAFVQENGFAKRHKVKYAFKVQVRGDGVRDWSTFSGEKILFPYDEELKQWSEIPHNSRWSWLFSLRTELWSRSTFGGGTYRTSGRPWFDYHQFPKDRARSKYLIGFAFVATHNHFVLDRGGKVFNRSAPVIKLPEGASEDEHLALLGLLNSAIACFWMQQVFHNKGRPGADAAAADEPWEFRFEHDGTKLQKFPLPAERPLEITKKLDCLAQTLTDLLPSKVITAWRPTNSSPLPKDLAKAHSEWTVTRAKMIALQEELDWQCYSLYKVLNEDLTYPKDLPLVHPGQRAFEIVLAQNIQKKKVTTVWFERLDAQATLEIPESWPIDYQNLVKKRIHLIENNRNIGLLEQFQHKRRWQVEPWDSQLHRALKTWLLTHLESYFDFDGRMNDSGPPTADPTLTTPTLISTATLADLTRKSDPFHQVGQLYRDDPAFNIQTLVDELIDKQTVPLLPILRYKPSGLRKRADWEHTWHLQRLEDAEDAGETVGTIPVPPKYATKDFAKPHYWKLRGKLDVPKERWLSFPHCEGPDGFPVIAWAGYDPLQLATAIANYYVRVQEDFGGSQDPRLTPLLACLLEIIPWVKQWHNQPNPAFNGLRMGDYYESFARDEAQQLGKTLDDIRAWQPPVKKKSKTKRKQKPKKNAEK